MIVDPPSEVGAVQLTEDCLSPLAVPATEVGAPGLSPVVTLEDAEDAVDVPKALVAVTVKVYAVASARPVTVQLVVDEVQVAPVFEVTV